MQELQTQITAMATKRTVEVSITSDLICPWCWVGLRKLQEAGKQANVEPKITWRPFQLRPNTPVEGIPKHGTPTSRVGMHLKQAGKSVGINFTGLTDRTPNTVLFHATMKMLQECAAFDPEIVTNFQEAVFIEYFTNGVYPDEDGLLVAAKKVENGDIFIVVRDLFRDKERLSRLSNEVVREAAEASRRGVSGVPSFSFGENSHQPAFSGAQPVEMFVRYLEQHVKE
jgi:predicted DsbA family dithiol-disulfide isomerase